MDNKLKIYACSGIGAAENKSVSFWTDDTNSIDNTQAVNTLLALINSKYILATKLANVSKQEKIYLLNDIDILSVCLEIAKRYSNNNEMLHRGGEVIGEMIEQGAFDNNSINADQREEHLEELVEQAMVLIEDNMPIEQSNAEFMQWYSTNVEQRNKVGLNDIQQKAVRKAIKKVSGIGTAEWMSNEELQEYLLKGSEYFLYLYFTDEQLDKLPSVFKIKRQKQKRTYNYCKSMFVDIYGSEEEMQSIIYAGIVDYFSETPEDVCTKIANYKSIKQIGVLTGAEIVSIITAVLALVGTIIASICSAVSQVNVAKYGALDDKIVEESVPAPEDMGNLVYEEKSSKGWLLPVLAGAALLLFKK